MGDTLVPVLPLELVLLPQDTLDTELPAHTIMPVKFTQLLNHTFMKKSLLNHTFMKRSLPNPTFMKRSLLNHTFMKRSLLNHTLTSKSQLNHISTLNQLLL